MKHGDWSVVFPEKVFARLHAHLFPGDNDEHGAIIAAGIAETSRGTKLLVRDLFLAEDGLDYVAGQRGYRMLRAEFIRDRVLHCRDERLVYLAVHNHPGSTGIVAFSGDDLASHERGYPALLDISCGMPVGALVFGQDAVAGEIWLPGCSRVPLTSARILGKKLTILRGSPFLKDAKHDDRYDRQARIFGDRGQEILRHAKVGVIGAGGVGMSIVENLARLGVGHILIVDPQRVEPTNIPRLTGASEFDALPWFTRQMMPRCVRRIAKRLATPKVRLACRIAKRANRHIKIEPIFGDYCDDHVAKQFLDCDFIFLAADTMQARALFNATVYQYLIPGIQVGSKVLIDKASGDVLDVYSVARPVTPDSGCLWCNGLIDRKKLQEESLDCDALRAMNYIDEPEVTAPSVITLNAIGVAIACNDFLFFMTGLAADDSPGDYIRYQPLKRSVVFDEPRVGSICVDCANSSASRRARGDYVDLPTKCSG